LIEKSNESETIVTRHETIEVEKIHRDNEIDEACCECDQSEERKKSMRFAIGARRNGKSWEKSEKDEFVNEEEKLEFTDFG
jgi:adenylyl- and sulfurtransferase ThiI